MSLRWRVAAGVGLIVALACTVAALGAYATTSRQLHRSLDDSLLSVATAVNRAAVARPTRRGPDIGAGTRPEIAAARMRACPLVGEVQPAVAAQLVTDSGDIIGCIPGGVRLPVEDTVLTRARGGDSQLDSVDVDGVGYRVLSVGLEGGGVLQVARGQDEVAGVLGQLGRRYAALSAAVVALAVGFGWVLAARVVRPVERLRDAAEHIARTQDLSTPVPVDGAGEVRSLARSITTMVGALDTSRQQQRRLVADAGHELRTPLTSLRTNVEHLRRAGDLPAAERNEVLDAVELEVAELSDLVAELVELASDVPGGGEAPDVVRLAELAEGAAVRARWRTGRDVLVSDDEGAAVSTPPQLLERAIANLIDNAAKYAPAAGPIEVRVAGGRLDVLDRGPGFDDADLPHVFDRFYRATSARTASGSGLGLAIVRQVVERQGGTVFAANRPGGGAAVGFVLPTVADVLVDVSPGSGA